MHRRWLLTGIWALAYPIKAREILSTPEEQDQFRSLQQQGTVQLALDLTRRELNVLTLEGTLLKTYPVAVGRRGWPTPKGNFQILKKIKDPAWEHIFTNEKFPGGTKSNPLGPYYLRFHTQGKNEFGIHGTNQPSSIGKAISHGCVRLLNKHITEVFSLVQEGTPLKVF